jgi:tetratricopeptide (TPR) repeat protein
LHDYRQVSRVLGLYLFSFDHALLGTIGVTGKGSNRDAAARGGRGAGAGANKAPPPETAVRAQVKRVLEAPALQANERRRAFLRYIVDETLAGRAERLKGYNIAVEALGHDQTFDSQTNPVVRLEARRLRQDLDHYFLRAGRDDPIRIDIPKGGYVPTFEWTLSPPAVSPTSPTTADVEAKGYRWLGWGPITITAVGFLALGALGTWLLAGSDESKQTAGQSYAENADAFAMFVESRQISRPPSNKKRMVAALNMAREIIEMNPDFSGGYAAESYLLWISIVFGHSRSPVEDAARALELAKKAILLDPEFAWGYQSLSQARHMMGDPDGAVTAAEYAVDLRSGDAELWGNLGLILTLTGRPAEAIEPLRTAIRLTGENVRTPYRNYIGIAYFHAGKFHESIEAIETNRRQGGPMGPHMYAYLAAAHAKAGNAGRAHAAAEHVRAASSDLSVRTFIESLFHDAEDRALILSALERSGLDLTKL